MDRAIAFHPVTSNAGSRDTEVANVTTVLHLSADVVGNGTV